MKTQGVHGSWTNSTDVLSNDYFFELLNPDYDFCISNVSQLTPGSSFKAAGTDIYMLSEDLVMRYNVTWRNVAQVYASDHDLFVKTFASAWTKLMNADRFDGPYKNLCPGPFITGAVLSPTLNPKSDRN